MKILNNPNKNNTQDGYAQYFNQSENGISISIVFMSAKNIVYLKWPLSIIQ